MMKTGKMLLVLTAAAAMLSVSGCYYHQPPYPAVVAPVPGVVVPAPTVVVPAPRARIIVPALRHPHHRYYYDDHRYRSYRRHYR
jgi:hypothetical protein